METSINTQSDKTTIRLGGRFDFNAHREFRDVVERALSGACSEVVVDLGEVVYLDSSALGMLLMLRDKANTAAKAVSLTNVRGSVRQVLDIANFGKLFQIS